MLFNFFPMSENAVKVILRPISTSGKSHLKLIGYLRKGRMVCFLMEKTQPWGGGRWARFTQSNKKDRVSSFKARFKRDISH